ncbi:Coenzyme F420 hydrogenase/dehydrogenase, beta subunit C-terminal domain, partial [Vescimonas sp.]|uniref:Coenzyme F420 hydrogenase/dehydrogenase, beta subunit C-terminal domain n=1 Tax=Vescimonas sp. TaxID=2892404 RepID=UPI003F804FF0
TAGGAFSALAEYVLEGGGVVFGAALDDGLKVSHIAVKNLHDLPRLRGAKPVQSDVGESYQQTRLYLDQGRQVLFSGTPCQVDGLYRYLGEHPERLITCDVACSGVCSPGIWEKLVRSMAYVKQQRPLTVDFCGKLSGDSVRRFHVSFENGGQYDAPLLRSELGRGITRGLFLRPACHTCGYTSTDRTGDLTLCDITGGNISPQEKQLGMSLLLVNTAKGAQIFDSLPLHRRRFDLAEAVTADQALRSPAPVSVDRTKFFDALEQEPFRQVCARFLSLMQPRARAARPLRELLHIPFKKRKDK